MTKKRLPEKLESPPNPISHPPQQEPHLIAASDYAVVPTACQYCVVGCGYEAHLWNSGFGRQESPHLEQGDWVSPAMAGTVQYENVDKNAAVLPDPKCTLNKGNHSPRGGTQGRNLVDVRGAASAEDSTRERIKHPHIRTRDGFVPLSMSDALDILVALVKQTTGWQIEEGKPVFATPSHLGVKLYEYQFLENTYCATKLFYQLIGTPNVAYHDRPSTASNTQGANDTGIQVHGYAYEDIWNSDVLFLGGNNPYENHSVFFMQYMAGKRLIVLDPRRTLTADYAVKTGGIHLQPRYLGADTLVLNALARYIHKKQVAGEEGWTSRTPLGLIADQQDRDFIRQKADASSRDDGPKWKRLNRQALTAEQFFEFLDEQGEDGEPLYTLARASRESGIPVSELERAARLLAGPVSDLPIVDDRKVSLIFEKGLIWGYSYQNTAAFANLGLLLGSVLRPVNPSQPGAQAARFGVTGRAGGHQKGWAEARYAGPNDPPERTTRGYPFHNASDKFVDGDDEFTTHHHFDTHLVGDKVAPAHPQSKVANPKDIQLLWIIGSNAAGQMANAAAKWKKVNKRRGPKSRYPAEADVATVIQSLKQRIADGGLVVIQQDIYPNPTTNFADLVFPAAGWGEEDFTRYNGERRLRLYSRFQDPPSDDCLPDWRLFKHVMKSLIPAGDSPDTHDPLRDEVESWETSAHVFRSLAKHSNRKKLLGALELDGDSEPQGHGELRRVGTNGYVLPVKRVGDELVSSLRQVVSNRGGANKLRPYRFIRADWKAIANDFAKNRPRPGEFAICNGRVNELWNSMFSHLRNETIRQRWPDNMPGVILEMHPDDAATIGPTGVSNGDVVEVQCDAIHMGASSGAFKGVVSLQPANYLPRGMVFAIFSYPVNEREDNPDEFPYRQFSLDGYVNNVTTGYVDPLNPIAAVKYARGRIAPTALHYPDDPDAHPYVGPTYLPRNIAFVEPPMDSEHDRLDWKMRELIVQKGLPRQRLHPDWLPFYAPDRLLELLRAAPNFLVGNLFKMQWPRDSGCYDKWEDPEKNFVENVWATDVRSRSSGESDMLELIENKRGVAQNVHDIVIVAPGVTLSELFRDREDQRILDYLQTATGSDGTRLVVAGKPEESLLMRQITSGVMKNFFNDDERAVVRRWIANLEDKAEPPPVGHAEAAMRQLLKDKQPVAQNMHSGVAVGGETLNELFAAERYDDILEFLKTANGSEGTPLVVPGKPEESLLFRQIDSGVMAFAFNEDETAVVRDWIVSLKGEPPPVVDAEAAMRQLLKDKQPVAQNMHSGVAVGGETLNELFAAERYDDILEFLKTANGSEGTPLVVPGKPEESLLFRQIDLGVMAFAFNEDETAVVRDWIVSLKGEPPPVVDAEAAMRQLLKDKQPVAQNMHSGIAVGGETLNELFAAERYDDILEFLKTANGSEGTPLVVPGKPEESLLYRQIDSGVMAFAFNEDETAVVANWIRSLTGASGGAIKARLVAEGFDQPLYVTAPAGDQQRLFVVEKTGAIKIVDLSTGTVRPEPFLQITGISTSFERGLLGLAFHPDYAANGRFFVNVTVPTGNFRPSDFTEIREYRVSANAQIADATTGKTILQFSQPFGNHNGGCIAFGPDGYLYIASGDGGGANDPDNRAQDTGQLLGKLLRIDVDSDTDDYSIPVDNPFVGTQGARDEIWSFGLRNPWRFSFDRQTGDLWIGDVGQNALEEINFQVAGHSGGQNYGWRAKEGTQVTGLSAQVPADAIDPIFEYSRDQGRSVTGGYVYRGNKIPRLEGTYVFGDFLSGSIWTLRRQGDSLPAVDDITDELAADPIQQISSFGEDAAGELYIVSLLGKLFRIEPA